MGGSLGIGITHSSPPLCPSRALFRLSSEQARKHLLYPDVPRSAVSPSDLYFWFYFYHTHPHLMPTSLYKWPPTSSLYHKWSQIKPQEEISSCVLPAEESRI